MNFITARACSISMSWCLHVLVFVLQIEDSLVATGEYTNNWWEIFREKEEVTLKACYSEGPILRRYVTLKACYSEGPLLQRPDISEGLLFWRPVTTKSRYSEGLLLRRHVTVKA